MRTRADFLAHVWLEKLAADLPETMMEPRAFFSGRRLCMYKPIGSMASVVLIAKGSEIVELSAEV